MQQAIGATTPGQGSTFVTYMQPYIKSRQVFVCPSGSKTNVAPPLTLSAIRDNLWRTSGAGWLETSEGHYGMNRNITTATGYAIANIVKTSETVSVFDATWYDASGELDVAVAGAMRHLDGMNLGYTDGHVKFLPKQKIFAGYANFYP